MLSETKFANTDFPDWQKAGVKQHPEEFNVPKPQRREEHSVYPSTLLSLQLRPVCMQACDMSALTPLPRGREVLTLP